MKPLDKRTARPLIRVVYLLPLIFGTVLLIRACVPHIFFILTTDEGADPHVTQSLFTLLSATRATCEELLNSGKELAVETSYFCYRMNFFVTISWIAIVLYGIFAVATAAFSTWAFSLDPFDRDSNRAKRWLQLFCPWRGLFVFFHLLPLIPAAFPLVLQSAYRQQALKMTAHFYLGNDLWWAAIATVLGIGLYLLTLSAQKEQRMDMYRIYKRNK